MIVPDQALDEISGNAGFAAGSHRDRSGGLYLLGRA